VHVWLVLVLGFVCGHIEDRQLGRGIEVRRILHSMAWDAHLGFPVLS
jgi:hypothetical protein